MKPEDLWEHYPVLYHIAWGGSWPSIEKYGLLSTSELLQEYGKNEEEIRNLTQVRRAEPVQIECPGRPIAVLRDQKPMTDEGLKEALVPKTVEPAQWYKLVNSMVFFWPNKGRFERMLKKYDNTEHDVLVVCTKRLVDLVESDIRLSSINSGFTGKNPSKRGLDHFKRFDEYPFFARLNRPRIGVENAIAEVCVDKRVSRIREAVIRIEHGTVGKILSSLEAFPACCHGVGDLSQSEAELNDPVDELERIVQRETSDRDLLHSIADQLDRIDGRLDRIERRLDRLENRHR